RPRPRQHAGLPRAADPQRPLHAQGDLGGAGHAPQAGGVREGALTMTAGLPGTGIGGLYYMLLPLWRPGPQARRALRRRRASHGWSGAARASLLAVGMLGALSAEAWFLTRALIWAVAHTRAQSHWHAATFQAWVALVPAAATWVTLVLLAGVVFVPRLLCLW